MKASSRWRGAAARWAGKLDALDSDQPHGGRKLSDASTTALFYRAGAKAHLANIIKVNLSAELFTYEIDQLTLSGAHIMDGKLVLVSNMPDHTPAEIVARYKALADVERGYRVLKSEIEITPVFHRLPNRIRVHAFICFVALVLYRVLGMCLKASNSQFPPEGALAVARRIQFHETTLHQRRSASSLSARTLHQKELSATVGLPGPSAKRLQCQFLGCELRIFNGLRVFLSSPEGLHSNLRDQPVCHLASCITAFADIISNLRVTGCPENQGANKTNTSFCFKGLPRVVSQ